MYLFRSFHKLDKKNTLCATDKFRLIIFIVNKQKDWTKVITTLVSPLPKHVQLTL